MRDIRASAEVAGMIGAENLHRVRRSPAYGRFTCWHCHGPGDADTEPATVIAELREGAPRITLAHAECARLQVVSPGAPVDAAITGGIDAHVQAERGEGWRVPARLTA